MQIHIPNLSAARVLIVGDVMLDRYWHGQTSRISPEAPVPVVRIEEREDRAGGAGNVALNVVALGGHATLLGLMGSDDEGRILTQRLIAAGVDCRLQAVPHHPTITKLRVISRHQQLIRLDFEGDFSDCHEPRLLEAFRAALATHDVVVMSDYGKGTLVNSRALIELARTAGKPVLVDPKSRDFAAYHGATIITPNYAEFEAVVGRCRDETQIEERGRNLMRERGLDALLVTRGEHGMTLLRGGNEALYLPTRAREVYDVTGAGDTVIAALATALAVGQDLPGATALANLAAGIVVGKLGTATVSAPELLGELRREGVAIRGTLGEDQLIAAVQQAREQGETIVMTNGCFDILHAGHVSYLEQARRLGDRLIVAVNDDASVTLLKGAGRPINTLERRMAVLAGLAAVDWVVPFSEDTPERLICRVLPDVLVKGGDYRPEQIAGHGCVTRAGGKVVVLGFEHGCSTTGLINSIREKNSP
jgi:D-beta-D-heptose 7-phosphate kinase / D-beta-D-heptose 1-phosphate adenosyltransferase